jgi:hypothetical protein
MGETRLVRKYRAVVIQQKHDCDFLVYRGDWKEGFFDADIELRKELSQSPGHCGHLETRLFAEKEPDATPVTMTFSEAVAKLKDGTVFITRLHPDWVGEKRRVCQGADGRLLISRETDYMLTYNWVPMLESLTAEDWVVAE